jgi:Rod binding domain-containing protein
MDRLREGDRRQMEPGIVKGDALVITEEKVRQEKKLRKACADFESIFLYQMFKTMRNTVPQGGLTNRMTGKDTYQMMMDQKVSEELANKGGMGLQGVLYNQLHQGKHGADIK